MKVLTNKKTLIALIAVVAIVCATVIGTVAYFTDTESVNNTFTVGKVNIELSETTTDYKMIPGTDIAKDPKVTVAAGSVDSWVFVKVEEKNNFGEFNTYSVNVSDTSWQQLKDTEEKDVDGVFYRSVPNSAENQSFYVLKGKGDGELQNGYVHVMDTVTKAMMSSITDTKPQLVFTAYACQKDGFADAYSAWLEVSKQAN